MYYVYAYTCSVYKMSYILWMVEYDALHIVTVQIAPVYSFIPVHISDCM